MTDATFGPAASRTPAPRIARKAGSVFSNAVSVGALNALAVLVFSGFFLVRAGIVGIWMTLPHGDTGVVDFAAFWASAKVVLAGHAAQAYDWPKLQAILEHASGVAIPKGLPIYYPPPFLMLIAPFGWLPYRLAFGVWVAASLAAFAAAVRLASRRLAVMIIALAGVGVFASAMVGQNGLFTAALIGAGLALVDRRPLLAGMLLGLLCYKPQLALLVPVALVAGGRWRTLAAAAATALALLLAAGLTLGWDVYAIFLAAGAHAGDSFATTGWVPWEKVQTVYGALREGRVGALPAFAACGAVALAAAGAVAWMWRSGAPAPLRVAAVAAGAFVATPYAFSYDAALLSMATAFILADVRRERPLAVIDMIALTAAFMAPFLANPWPTTAPSAAILLGVALLRALRRPQDRRITEISPPVSHPSGTVEAST